MKVKSHIILIGVFGSVMGCSAGINPEQYLLNKQNVLISQGNPPTFIAGYLDGCSTGRRLGGDNNFAYRKNNARFENDSLYANGWQEGHINCRNEILIEEQTRHNQDMNINVDEARRQRMEKDSREADAEIREIWEGLKK